MLYHNLVAGYLIKRYKRFLADVRLLSGEVVTVYCPNTGSMKGCIEPNVRVWISKTDNHKRKYIYTLEIIEISNELIGINTALPNQLVLSALKDKQIVELSEYPTIKSEVKYGKENSRIDFLLTKHEQQCFVEVKNVTLVVDEYALFPDAVTTRGQKHLRELMAMVQEGHRAIILFCVQHTGATKFRVAHELDLEYAKLFTEAMAMGVEVLVYNVDLCLEYAKLDKKIPYVFTEQSKNFLL